jgi:hypothetical protein
MRMPVGFSGTNMIRSNAARSGLAGGSLCMVLLLAACGGGGGGANGYSLSAGQWAYVAVVIDKTALTMKGYVMDPVKGIHNKSVAITSARVAKLGGLGNRLGLNEDGTGLYYQREASSPRSAMDFNDFAIWNRALTSDDLASTFKSRQPLSTLPMP